MMLMQPSLLPRRSYPGKRLFDIAVLVLVAVPGVVLSLGCALLVGLSSRGPILFRQRRVGMDGETFVILKFRTMIDGDNPIIPADDRITRVGRFLRRLSLDELPQLLNVARGEMSVVGPRPTLPYQAERWTPHQHKRLMVRPGLTGWAQVNGRNKLSWTERIDLDIAYVQRQSIRFDARILARTGSAMLAREGTEPTAADDPIASLELETAMP